MLPREKGWRSSSMGALVTLRSRRRFAGCSLRGKERSPPIAPFGKDVVSPRWGGHPRFPWWEKTRGLFRGVAGCPPNTLLRGEPSFKSRSKFAEPGGEGPIFSAASPKVFSGLFFGRGGSAPQRGPLKPAAVFLPRHPPGHEYFVPRARQVSGENSTPHFHGSVLHHHWQTPRD